VAKVGLNNLCSGRTALIGRLLDSSKDMSGIESDIDRN
jgi:hypothetical protein